MPIWSRSARDNAGKKAVVPEQDQRDAAATPADQLQEDQRSTGTGQQDAAGSEDRSSAQDFLVPWLEGLGAQASGDTLLHFRPSAGTSIDLTHAHPSGLAQLLAGRRTRLSTLLRDPVQYSAAKAAARALRAKIFELGTERGIDVGYLAAGTASWRSVDDAGRSETLNAPVLLTAVSLTVHASQDDYELQITEQARMNPALVRHLRDHQGLQVDPTGIARLAYGTARFDPYPVLERMRVLADGVRGMSVEHRILVSTFADLAGVKGDPALRPEHPVLAALIASARGDAEAASVLSGAADGLSFPPADERDPAHELLILDADRAQQEVLDLASAGVSLAVATPPGTGQTQTALNVVARAAAAGSRVVVAAERRGTLNELVQDLDGLNLGSLVLQLGSQTGPAQLREAVIRALVRNEKATEPHLESLHSTLTGHRHQLMEHVRSLHNVRSRWACSPYQAMQSLAGLTALDPAPSTTVRLKRSVLDSIADRKELSERLRRAAELGSFSKASTESPWYGAQLLNRKETEHAHGLAQQLSTEIPDLRNRVQRVAEHSHITLGATFREWGEQLELLVAVRGSLDKFTPDIFDRPVTDLISATAPSSWRKERDIEMSSMTRSRLRRVAKEYIRPGVHISDLHTSLLEVQQQRTLWTRYALTERHPSVPTGLAEINASYQAVEARLADLTEILRPTSRHPDLASLELDGLEAILSGLALDRETLETLPERTLLLDEMREQGLGELLADLAAREVPAEGVGPELELAWWQSALEAMISGDDYLAMSDGASLRKLEAEYRLADNAHIASGPARIRWTLAERWRNAVADHPDDAGRLRQELKDGTLTLEVFASLHRDLVAALLPVWAVSPLTIRGTVPEGYTFDTAVVLDGESMSLQSAVPCVARAAQVVVFGDDRLAHPTRFSIEVQAADRATTLEPLPSAFDSLREVLPVRGLTEVYRGVDRGLDTYLSESFYDGKLSRLPQASEVTGEGRGLVVEYLPNGTGMPSSEHDGVESVDVEVNRVVELVFDHIRRRPSFSLAVVTASARHAARVGEAIRLQMAEFPWAADFFTPRREAFRVVPVQRAGGLVRDDIIFSLGYGRTPHGRALHSFGPLSGSDGRQNFVMAMTRARRLQHVLTCFEPSDLDPDRLTTGALDFFELLQRELGGDAGHNAVRSGGNEDPLVADLVDRLRYRGADVWDHYAGVLDIVAVRPPGVSVEGSADGSAATVSDERPAPLAIESDGTTRYGSMSVRERSRLRPQVLERMGWRYMPLWTIEVFTDPDGCALRASALIGLPPREMSEQPRTRKDAARMRKDEQHPGRGIIVGREAGAAEDASPALPTTAGEDDPRAWGDAEENHDEWLQEQRPPHWG
ncbi:DUF4011 domain-containing protein [Arthrobacter sp. NamB2]|uniref:DUF4011 domain-containing protein n=1 Tax=Arthrobacter sp. NamB2 TaxID=2576035 RepID=UPI0010C99B4C|nr:DUF4011 domain-containing protein [Arthrobacter sp. NamB2]TKV29583.1 DUF4011 domain-containing protein [Arthrobacter sp. NamB2]